MYPDDPLSVPDSRRTTLLEMVARLRAAERVVLTTHENADGDGAGSEVALAGWLASIGVEATIVNPTTFPSHLGFMLSRSDLVADLAGEAAERALAEADLAVVIDTSEANRIGPLADRLQGVATIVLDHHPPGPTVVGEGGVQDPSASAAAEIIYDIISLAGGPWPADAALGIYVGIVSDTGSFRFSNTTPRAHRIAAEMLARGVDPEFVFERLFASFPLRRIELLRESLAHLEHDPEAGLAWMLVPLEVTERLGSHAADYEGLIDHARSIEGTRVAILFREMPDGVTKVSFRATGDTDVNRIARHFGGGGHVKASGATIAAPPEEAMRRVLGRVREDLK
jgi:bifunctional oligoribonuclease and PAP phosphatase NrnA